MSRHRKVEWLLSFCVFVFFFFSSRRRHTRSLRDWSSDVCSSDLNSVLFSVPTADFRTGDFNRKLGAQILDRSGSPIMVPTTEGGLVPLQQGMIFDPFSGNPNGTGRAVFSSGGRVNVIPASRFTVAMFKMLALVPLPNQPGDNANYFNTGIQRLNRNNFDGKVNWNRSERHQLWFKYSAMKALVHGDFG